MRDRAGFRRVEGKTRTWAVVLVVVALVGLPLLAGRPASADDVPKITVNGEALVNVEPDRIVISFGIETSDPDILVAKAANGAILSKAVAALGARGITRRDIQTNYLDVMPRYEDEYQKRTFIGFFVRQAFAVTLNAPAKIEGVVGDALASGVNYVHGIDFQTSGLRAHRDRARDLALKAASEKAKAMAAALGRTVGAPLQISEGYSGGSWWYNSGWWGAGSGLGQGMSQNVVQEAGSGASEVSDGVALGKVSVRASVSVTFALQ